MSQIEQRNRYFDQLWHTPGLLWLGQNTNHLPVHPAVRQAMLDSIAAEEFHAYAPPLGFESLRAAILEDLGVPGMNSLVTEGGVNALATVVRACLRPGGRLLTTDPTWKWPGLFALQAGAEVVELPIYGPESGYRLSPETLGNAAAPGADLIYIVDPNNPLGSCYNADELSAFAAIAADAGALLVHDCTYRDFADGHVPATAIAPDNAVVSLSFSKWLGLAGLRIGALVAKPALIERFAASATNVLGASVIAQRAAEAGLKVKAEWMAEVRRIDRTNKARLREAVMAAGFTVPVYPSHGNFLVVEMAKTGISPEALVEAARRENFLIRQGVYHTARFGSRFVKISTSVPEAWITAFCTHLPNLVAVARTLNAPATQF